MINTDHHRKIQAIETLLDSLCSKENNLDSPGWHLELLEQREITLNQGTDTFEEWNKAKQDLRKQLL